MRQIIAVIVGLGVSGSFIQAREGHDNTVLEFNTMVGNSGPFIGTRKPHSWH
jgi:hypothetical protein